VANVCGLTCELSGRVEVGRLGPVGDNVTAGADRAKVARLGASALERGVRRHRAAYSGGRMLSNMLTSSTLCVSHAVPILSGKSLGRTR
jgi:hypothetical protein